MEESKFAILERQKQILSKKYDDPVFIDIKKWKLYIVTEEGEKEYVFSI